MRLLLHGVAQMISYSKIFKASQLTIANDVKVISQPQLKLSSLLEESEDAISIEAIGDESVHLSVQEAKEQAQAIMEEAEHTAGLLLASAEEKIKQWWKENEDKLEVTLIDAKHQGYEDGYLQGKLEAETELRTQYDEKLNQVQQILTDAFEQKKAIIDEAEPFLLELSASIAEQIVKQELKSYPHKFVELIQQHIIRFKEKEHITICVHPDDFELIHSQRAHLLSVVNGETEIRIIPDHSVSQQGCIIRTAYGSIDARIDTQIEEIKKAILEIGRE